MSKGMDWYRVKWNPLGMETAKPRAHQHDGHVNGGKVKRFSREELEAFAAQRGSRRLAARGVALQGAGQR